MSDLSRRLKECLATGQQEILRKHVIRLALYRGSEDELLEEAFKEVHDPAGRKALLVIYNAAQHFAEVDYYRDHSALCDGDAAGEDAEAQIRWAHERRDRVIDGIVERLVDEIPKYIEEPLAKFAAGDARWGAGVVEGLMQVVIHVAAIRELCDSEADKGNPASVAVDAVPGAPRAPA